MKNFILLIVFVPLVTFAKEKINCENAWTTLAINHCMHKDLLEAENTMNRYFAKSLEKYAEDSVSIASMKKGQDTWLNYRDHQCKAVYNTWRDGTIRTAKQLGCQLALTHQRTKILWQSFLTYVDSTPPLLPEPQAYEPKSY